MLPLIGRGLSSSDDRIVGKGGSDGAVAVISRAYWQERFGGDPAVIGRSIYLFDHSVTIVGVMPTEIMTLEPGRPVDIAAPMALSSPEKMRDRTSLWLMVAARLKPSIPLVQARAETETLFRAYMADVQIAPEVRARLFDHMDLAPAAKGLSGLRRQFSKPLTALMILAGLVLLAACVNMTNLMLARAVARQRDFAVRLAIGASRGRLVRQNADGGACPGRSGRGARDRIGSHRRQGSGGIFRRGQQRDCAGPVAESARTAIYSQSSRVLSAYGGWNCSGDKGSSSRSCRGTAWSSRSIAGNRASMRLWPGSGHRAGSAFDGVARRRRDCSFRSLRQLESVDLGFVREGILTMEVAPERRLHGSSEWLAMQADILEPSPAAYREYVPLAGPL